MKSTFNICFYAKKDKQKANGAYPLFARITVDGVASRFNTKLDVLPSIWDGKMGKATGRTSEASRINRMLDDINASLNTIYHEMQRRDNYVTAEKVKNEFLGHSESHETILTLFQKHNDDVKQLVGISKTIATYRKYEVTRHTLQNLSAASTTYRTYPLRRLPLCSLPILSCICVPPASAATTPPPSSCSSSSVSSSLPATMAYW